MASSLCGHMSSILKEKKITANLSSYIEFDLAILRLLRKMKKVMSIAFGFPSIFDDEFTSLRYLKLITN